MSAPNSLIADGVPPAERQNLTHAYGTCMERGKPVGLPPSVSREGKRAVRPREAKGTPTGLRVKDGGRSECLLVMRGIGVELSGYDRERSQTATSLHAKAG